MRGLITCYFWTAIVLAGGLWLLSLSTGNATWPSVTEVPLLVVGLVTMVGLGGLVFGKPLGNVSFWKIWLAVEGARTAYVFVRAFVELPERIDARPAGLDQAGAALLLIVLGLIVFVVVAVPPLIGLYLYAFEAPDIWSADRSDDEAPGEQTEPG